MYVLTKYLVPSLVAVLVVIVLVLLIASSTPKLEMDRSLSAVGTATPVTVEAADPHGVRHVAARLVQGDHAYPVFESNTVAHRIKFFKNEAPKKFSFAVGTKNAPGLKDGKANLVVEATSNDLRGSTTTLNREVMVVTQPPSLSVDDKQHYINQGGSELVTYSVGGYAVDSGVKVDGFQFRSFPLPGTHERFSLFAFPWNVTASTKPVVFATNSADEVTKNFWFRIFPKKFRKRDFVVNDAFLQRIVPKIDPSGSGDLLARFLKINRDMRQQNNKVLADLRFKTAEKFLWSGPFLPLINATVESSFADDRTYIYKGKKIDEEVHLGFDLAKLKNSPIPASNDGKVLFADNLGIYGNCVVIDHGYGLQSIYGHLSEFKVKPGDMVKKAQTIGLTGSTGLAEGDHLHFSMQVDGVQVNAVEWWDPHWIHDRILSKISTGP